MGFPLAITKILELTDLNDINATQAEISADMLTLWQSFLGLADKELQMFAISTLDSAFSGNQEVLRQKVNDILNCWK